MEQLRPLVTKLKECVMEVVEKAKRAMTFVLLQEAACSIPQGFLLQQRRDVVFSQAVGGLTETLLYKPMCVDSKLSPVYMWVLARGLHRHHRQYFPLLGNGLGGPSPSDVPMPALTMIPQSYHHRPVSSPPIKFTWFRTVSHRPSIATQRKKPLLLDSGRGCKVEGKPLWSAGCHISGHCHHIVLLPSLPSHDQGCDVQ